MKKIAILVLLLSTVQTNAQDGLGPASLTMYQNATGLMQFGQPYTLLNKNYEKSPNLKWLIPVEIVASYVGGIVTGVIVGGVSGTLATLIYGISGSHTWLDDGMVTGFTVGAMASSVGTTAVVYWIGQKKNKGARHFWQTLGATVAGEIIFSAIMASNINRKNWRKSDSLIFFTTKIIPPLFATITFSFIR